MPQFMLVLKVQDMVHKCATLLEIPIFCKIRLQESEASGGASNTFHMLNALGTLQYWKYFVLQSKQYPSCETNEITSRQSPVISCDILWSFSGKALATEGIVYCKRIQYILWSVPGLFCFIDPRLLLAGGGHIGPGWTFASSRLLFDSCAWTAPRNGQRASWRRRSASICKGEVAGFVEERGKERKSWNVLFPNFVYGMCTNFTPRKWLRTWQLSWIFAQSWRYPCFQTVCEPSSQRLDFESLASTRDHDAVLHAFTLF